MHDPESVEPRRRRPRPPRKRLSEILNEIAADTSRSEITVADLVSLMEGRARAALIFLFAFPNVLPTPPGFSAILGMPLLYLTSQMMLGRVPWLPRVIGMRGMPMSAFAALVDRVTPILTKAERLLRPRWSWVLNHRAENVLGAFTLLLAIVLTLPIPLGNMLPALSICLVALGVLERDGLTALLGVVTGIAALLLSGAVVVGMIKVTVFVILGAFS